MPQPYSEMEESRSVTPWVNRLYFESPRASSFLGLRLVKAKHKNLVPLLSGVKPDPMVGSGRYTEPIPVKCPLGAHVTMSFIEFYFIVLFIMIVVTIIGISMATLYFLSTL